MRVALVSSGSGSRGGGEIYLVFLAKGFVELGCDVTVLVPESERMNPLADMLAPVASVIRYPFRATYDRRLRTLGAVLDMRQQARLTRMFAELAVDVIHVNQQVAEDGVDLVLAASRSGKPWVSTIHVGHSARALGAELAPVRDLVTSIALRLVSGRHIAVAEAARKQLADRLGRDGPSLFVVHNGVPVPSSAALSAARTAARANWGVGEGDIVVGAVGRIEAQKQPLSLVDHLAPFAGRVRLVWIGEGSMRTTFEAYAAQHGALLTVDGWRSDASMRMAGFDVFVLPSRYEGLPLALLEAMHAGLPIVATCTDGVVEAIQHGKTGLLCTSDEEWRKSLGRLVTDGDQRSQLGAAARTDALARFSSSAMAQATLNIYRS